MFSTSVESKLLQELQDLTAQMKTLNSRVGRIEKDLDEGKRGRYRSEGNNWRGGSRNQKSEQKPSVKSESTSTNQSDNTLNQQAPPWKGQ